MTPQQHQTASPSQFKHTKYKHEINLERIPFDETSKFLDAAFDGEKEHCLNSQYIKHARDKYKCYCSVCKTTDSHILEVSPEKTMRASNFWKSPEKSKTSKVSRSMSLGQSTMYYQKKSEAVMSSVNNNNESEHSGNLGYQNTDHDVDLSFILKRLIPPSRVTRTLRIFIPETVVFWNNEARLLIFNNSKDNQLRFIKQREKLQLNELRKFLNERRTKYRQSVEAMNSTISGGTISANGTERSEKESREAVIYKADSSQQLDCSHTIAINETDFLVLMMKRKIDPIWTNIHYLQNFIKVKKNKFEFQRTRFIYEEFKDSKLFLRAFRDIQVMNGEISSVSQEYISPEQEEEFEKQLMATQLDEYQIYMASKIFHFVQTFHNATISSMDTEWLLDDFGILYLISCDNIAYIGQGRTYITTEMYFKRIEAQAEKKLKLREGMEDKFSDQRKEAIGMFQKAMSEDYEAKKKKIGIVQQKKVRQEIDISNEVFEKICPDIKFKLSDLLRTNAPIRVLQKEILGEKSKTLREKNEERSSQMFSKVYSSPQKSYKSTSASKNSRYYDVSTVTMRETFSVLSKIDPPHRRVFSAQHSSRRIKSASIHHDQEETGYNNNSNTSRVQAKEVKAFITPQRMSTTKSAYQETDSKLLNNFVIESPSIKLDGGTIDYETDASTAKKHIKVKKKTLPYYLFCSPSS